MFTGIITDKGTIKAIDKNAGVRLRIKTGFDISKIPMGASVACSGVCLTVVGKNKDILDFDVSQETLDKTTIGTWGVGQSVNLERPLKVGDELGGHIVSGHVDGIVEIIAIKVDGTSKRLSLALPKDLSRFVAQKGSVTLDGVSLTVNDVRADSFDVNIVPHSLAVTSLCEKQVGDKLNLEIDILARYLSRLAKI